MGGLREGLNYAQWMRLNWLDMENSGSVQTGSHIEALFPNIAWTIEATLEAFVIMLEAKGPWHICKCYYPKLQMISQCLLCVCLTSESRSIYLNTEHEWQMKSLSVIWLKRFSSVCRGMLATSHLQNKSVVKWLDFSAVTALRSL